MTISRQEEQIDKDLAQMDVKAHITHLKQPEDGYYSYITIATPEYEEYRNLSIALSKIYLEGSIRHKTGSALDELIVRRFAEFGVGASPCHSTDNFSRRRGRIISGGRLLKLLNRGVIK